MSVARDTFLVPRKRAAAVHPAAKLCLGLVIAAEFYAAAHAAVDAARR